MSVAEIAAPSDLYITVELQRRAPKAPDYLGEKLALQDIAAQMVDHPEKVLPELVERAMQLTGAASAGISVYEPQEGTEGIFRWRDLRGELLRFAGATTPRDYSPCGVCLDRFETTLTRHPERHYSWLIEAGILCPEVLLEPLHVAHGQPLGTLWVVAEREGYFDSGHARVLKELASFVAIALAMAQDKKQLQEAVKQQELLTAEMDHRVKNLFSVVDAMIRISKRSAKSADEMATILSGRLHAMGAAHALVRRSFDPNAKAAPPPTARLSEVFSAVLKPYVMEDAPRFVATGPDIHLGREATTSLALVFHELVTNAAKYGALTQDGGLISISWRQMGAALSLRWRETGGPAILSEPAQNGFGGKLTRHTVEDQLGGTFTLDWRHEGLVADFTLPMADLTS